MLFDSYGLLRYPTVAIHNKNMTLHSAFVAIKLVHVTGLYFHFVKKVKLGLYENADIGNERRILSHLKPKVSR